MIDILVSERYTDSTCTDIEQITVSSKDVVGVVYPCSSYERFSLLGELQHEYGFRLEEIKTSSISQPLVIDWVQYLGERHPMRLDLECCQIRGVWIVFANPFGDFFSFVLAEEWLRQHFSCAIYDPNNFHVIVSAINEASGKSSCR